MILSRLRDWLPWEPPPRLDMAPAHSLSVKAPATEAPRLLDAAWPPERLAVTETLWGEGYTTPGAEAELLRLAKPLGLNGASSVLLLGCGAGGPARCLAEAFGAWVGGFEADEALADAASRRCAGLGKRVHIAPWDPALPRFPGRAFHHGLTLDSFRSSEVEDILPAVSAALRPGCNLVLSELADADPAIVAPQLDAWLCAEGRAVPPTREAVNGELERLGFDIRIAEDITQRHVNLTITSWYGLVQRIRTLRPDPAWAAALVAEAERCLLRARLMRSGRLCVMRWHALRHGP